MTHPVIRTAVFTILAALTAGTSFAADRKIQFIVRVPPMTSGADFVYLAGALPEVGAWQPDGVKLARQPDGTYAATVSLPIGQSLDYKITRGTWGTVETNADGSGRPNRRISIDANTDKVEITVDRWATHTPAPTIPHTVVGNLKLHKLDSRALAGSRTIRIWLPSGYDADSTASYPVLYMHDGQNCFDRATAAFGNEWQIDETLTKLIADKRIPPMIVVGIDNGGTNRLNELTYDIDSSRGGGQSATYAEFLLNEVKPFVDKTYRTKPDAAHTYLGGSSLGGLASLDIPRRHPQTFAGIIAMSPSLSWADRAVLNAIEKDPGGLTGTRVWIDTGTREVAPDPKHEQAEQRNKQYVALAQSLDGALTKHHVDHRLFIDSDHPGHNEPAWAARFPEAIEYILNTN